MKLDSNKTPIRVGFWREQPIAGMSNLLNNLIGASAVLPWPADHVAPITPQLVTALTSYLTRPVFRSLGYMGYSACRLCYKTDNGTHDYTDGVYVWPEGYAHYVMKHSVRPPQDFIDHVRTSICGQ